MAATMKAVQFREYGGPDKLAVVEVPRPEPGPNEILVRMRTAGVNPADWKLREGYIKEWAPLPWVCGLDGAGVVEAVGSEVEGFTEGDEVFGPITSSYAEYAKVKPDVLTKIPDILDFEAAASVPVGALTAWKIVEDAGVTAGQRVVVQGAAGGVGLFAVQFAKLRGAEVLGTCSKDNLEFVTSLGADEAVDYATDALDKLDGINTVIDTVGGESVERVVKVIKRGGLFVTIAGALPEDQAAEGGFRAVRSGRAAAQELGAIADLMAHGKVRTQVQKVFPFAEARAAQELCQTGHGRGRIVLRVSE